jgi:heme-degrading monooxygenase HmoA
MVLEHALITVPAGQEEAFEAAFRQARAVIESSPGCRRAWLHRGSESPQQFLLLVEWEHLDDHLVGFRQSERFTQWRSLVGPFFEHPPQVDHYNPVADVGSSPG